MRVAVVKRFLLIGARHSHHQDVPILKRRWVKRFMVNLNIGRNLGLGFFSSVPGAVGRVHSCSTRKARACNIQNEEPSIIRSTRNKLMKEYEDAIMTMSPWGFHELRRGLRRTTAAVDIALSPHAHVAHLSSVAAATVDHDIHIEQRHH